MGGFEPKDFTIPSTGEVVQLRGLSGFEVVLSRKRNGDDEIGQNAFMIGTSMGADVKSADAKGLAFMKDNLAGDFEAMVNEIRERSGMAEGARKSDLSGDGEPAGE